jgi:hypothetical protein
MAHCTRGILETKYISALFCASGPRQQRPAASRKILHERITGNNACGEMNPAIASAMPGQYSAFMIIYCVTFHVFCPIQPRVFVFLSCYDVACIYLFTIFFNKVTMFILKLLSAKSGGGRGEIRGGGGWNGSTNIHVPRSRTQSHTFGCLVLVGVVLVRNIHACCSLDSE